MMTAICLRNVCKMYGDRPVVNDLSLDIPQGEMFALLGPNGAGKSTTIRMLTTLTRPTRGQVAVCGYDVVRQAQAVKRCIGVVLQTVSLDGDLTLWETLELHGRLHHLPNPHRQNQINHWLDYMELSDRRDNLVRTLSGGMKRRLQIARALLHQPEILFLDEPTVGLDPQTRRRLWEVIQDLNRQGMTILLTTHYMDEVEYLCDPTLTGSTIPSRVGIMDMGRLIELGTLTELRHNYGRGLVMKQEAGQWHYIFFPELEDANAFLEQQPSRTGMMARPSNLEDIFVELTGRKLD
ncbi:MAG: ABC transporter ATP-binding protein [Cyanobacteria bacterium]|nr:ABC transporter ATP-binding protein [Cyanobacteriota bacterium]MDW8200702.1 ABC transporter ATP-binding protein [Cyanobacteriota bacterium SKYGB_h_bin112]